MRFDVRFVVGSLLINGVLWGCQTRETPADASTHTTNVESAAVGSSAGSTAARIIPPLVATATIHGQWPQLPITIQGHHLTAVLDLGTINTWVAPEHAGITLMDGGNGKAIDAVEIGKTWVYEVPIGGTFGGVLEGATVLLGSAFLSQYDLVFDGPAQQVRLYPATRLHFATATERQPRWFPPGVVAGDCVPMGDVAAADMRVFLPMRVNGHVVHGIFDSGSQTTNMNLAEARLIGFAPPNPHVQQLPWKQGFSITEDESEKSQTVWSATGITVQLGQQTVTPGHVLIFPHMPAETGPEFNLGLQDLRNRVFYISYSSGTVCLSAPRDTSTPGHAPSTDSLSS